MVTIWKEDMFEEILSFRGVGFLGVKLSCRGNCFYVVNVYSPCSLQDKRTLWESLLEKKAIFADAEWVLAGDFNSVRNKTERKGKMSGGKNSETKSFNNFLDSINLIDVPCKGKKYSWFSGDNKSFSRIDRFLISGDLINAWGVVGQFIGNIDILDHSPMWLVIDKEDWGPKPFKFNNGWFDNKFFLPYVESSWKDIKVYGRSDYVLKEKLRLLKIRLHDWNVAVYGKNDLEIKEGVKAINVDDEFVEWCVDDHRVEEVVRRRSSATCKLWNDMRIKDNLLFQNSRLKWDLDGDANTKFFHSVMKERRRLNHIGSISTDSGFLAKVGEVKDGFWSHFSSKFVEEYIGIPTLDGLVFKKLNGSQVSSLEASFLETEIRDAVWSCDGSKSPGPDDFNFLFLRKCWLFIKEDFIMFVNDFHRFATLSKSITSSFLSLIPKKENPLLLDYYRPIFLVGYLHKLISKLLAARLKKVLKDIVSDC
ncbi:uncharacterized protein LOC131619219 [Vicia villosa]|uniref:uncharacterized protein LOC131619219 n=1 Tax=Vicia villosa TaxID=3911 RepID=UPI00273CB39C|nr:uncharacterized protein LOC131619219 [Vicia villosa]